MTIELVAPGIAVNVDNVESVHYTENTDEYKERHVIINFKDYGHDIPPQFRLEEVLAAMDGKCYYTKWIDHELGPVDYCVLHNTPTKHDPKRYGPYRLCLTRDPAVEYTTGSLFAPRVELRPDVSQSWEARDADMEKLRAKFLENVDSAPTIVRIDEKVSPETVNRWVNELRDNNDPKPSTPVDMLPYELRPDYKTPNFWRRWFGL